MSEEIKVTVTSYGNGRALTLVWVDPITGKRKTRSAKTKDWNKAERTAGELEAELASGVGLTLPHDVGMSSNSDTTLRSLSTLAPTTRETALAGLRHVKRVLNIEHLGKLSPSAMSKFAAECRKEGMKDTTLAHHLRHIKAAPAMGGQAGADEQGPGNRNAETGQGAIASPVEGDHHRGIRAGSVGNPQSPPHRCGPMGTVRHRVVAERVCGGPRPLT